MQNTTERRQLMLEYINDRRSVTVEELAFEFDICERTVRRDIQILSCSHPIETQQGGGGGIRAADGWYLYRRYLCESQEAFLCSLLPGLQPEERKTMESILAAFSRPRPKQKKKEE